MVEDDFGHGQTYGEAVEDALIEGVQAAMEAYALAANLRVLGGEDNEERAAQLEAEAETLTESIESLLETSEKMPFGLDSAEDYVEILHNHAVKASEEHQRAAWMDDAETEE